MVLAKPPRCCDPGLKGCREPAAFVPNAEIPPSYEEEDEDDRKIRPVYMCEACYNEYTSSWNVLKIWNEGGRSLWR